MNEVFYSSSKEDWETPEWLFEKLNNEFCFDVDVAADRNNTKCVRFYDKESNGLLHEWHGTVWCNPPYGRQIADWVRKASESKCTTVMLLPARTNADWFHDYIWKKPGVEIRFLRHKIKFVGARWNAPFPSMVVVFWRDPDGLY